MILLELPCTKVWRTREKKLEQILEETEKVHTYIMEVKYLMHSVTNSYPMTKGS